MAVVLIMGHGCSQGYMVKISCSLVTVMVVVKVMLKNYVLGHGHGCSQGYVVKNHVLVLWSRSWL
jgi:hypothetical protein